MEELDEVCDKPATENQTEEEAGHVSAAEEIIEEFSVSDAVADGASLVEEYSPQGAADNIGAAMNIPTKIVHYIMAAIYIVLGVLCICITKQMLSVLSYIVGSFMALIGLIQLISAIKKKEYVQTHSNKTAGSLILFALAIMILIDREWASTFIPIVWGVIGLVEAAHAFNHAFSRIARGMRCSFYLVRGIIEVVLAFLLLYEPVHHITLHVIVFGVNLIVDGIALLPFVKNFTAKR